MGQRGGQSGPTARTADKNCRYRPASGKHGHEKQRASQADDVENVAPKPPNSCDPTGEICGEAAMPRLGTLVASVRLGPTTAPWCAMCPMFSWLIRACCFQNGMRCTVEGVSGTSVRRSRWVGQDHSTEPCRKREQDDRRPGGAGDCHEPVGKPGVETQHGEQAKRGRQGEHQIDAE